MEIYANVIQGSLRVISNGGNGSPGQEGARGGDSPNSLHEVIRAFLWSSFKDKPEIFRFPICAA